MYKFIYLLWSSFSGGINKQFILTCFNGNLTWITLHITYVMIKRHKATSLLKEVYSDVIVVLGGKTMVSYFGNKLWIITVLLNPLPFKCVLVSFTFTELDDGTDSTSARLGFFVFCSFSWNSFIPFNTGNWRSVILVLL